MFDVGHGFGPGAAGGGESNPEATLWVNSSTGSDSHSKATIAASGGSLQWQTIGRAAWGNSSRGSMNSSEAAAAGDVVSVAAGTYSTAVVVNNKFDPLYRTVNSGASGNPITFIAEGTVVLQNTGLLGPVLGQNASDYITFQGPFSIDIADNPSHSDTGPVTFSGCEGCVLDGAIINGTNPFSWGDNHNGVRLEGATAITVKNCTLNDWYDGSGSNGSFFTLYGCQDCIIEHNRGDGAGTAVYFKDTGSQPAQMGNIVRYNHFSNTLNSFFRWSIVTAPADEDRNYVYQNLCEDGHRGINIIGARNDYIYNNTFVRCNEGCAPAGDGGNTVGLRYWNNIFEDCPLMIAIDSTPMPTAATTGSCQHNVYHTFSTFYSGSDGSRTFANYLSTFTDQDQTSPASITSDPLFVDAANGNYRLQGGSPAVNLGRHPESGSTVNAGCYITGLEEIGIES